MRTDRPASWTRAGTTSDPPTTTPPRLVPRSKWPRHTLPVAPWRKRGRLFSGASASPSRIDATRADGLFIEPYEVAQRHGVRDVVGFGKRIESERLLEPRDEDGDRERV